MISTINFPNERLIRLLVMYTSIICFGLLIIQQAWLCDDSFITLRVVKNWHQGYGLRWNVAERVQVYTHPLWMLMLSFGTLITHEYVYTTLALSIIISLLAFHFLLKIAQHLSSLIIASLVLFGSQSFINYSTSGLENPLSHLLLIGLVFLVLSYQQHRLYALFLGLMTSCIILNRIDLSMLIGPLIAMELWKQRSKRTLVLFISGLIPFFIWECFSIVYYGFPVPNTAYAKVSSNNGEPRFINGLRYYLFSLRYDTLTLIGIVVGIVIALRSQQRTFRMLALGIGLYLAYWIYVGGDYMGGRAFSICLWLAMIIFVIAPIQIPFKPMFYVSITITLLVIFNAIFYIQDDTSTAYIVNEREFYKKGYALAYIGDTNDLGNTEHRSYAGDVQISTTLSWAAIGIVGFYNNAQLHIIDPIGLSDALTARLPPLYNPNPRPGHLYRAVPDGYQETWETGTNRISDPELAQYYDQLALITQGPLWTRERWRAIWAMNTGEYNTLIDKHYYTFAGFFKIPYESISSISTPLAIKGGIEIQFQNLQYATQLQVELDTHTPWTILWYQDSNLIAVSETEMTLNTAEMVSVHEISIPYDAYQSGFNTLMLVPSERFTQQIYSIGALIVTDNP